MPKRDYVSYFIQKSQQPGFDFSSMRKELENEGVPENDIKTIVRLVDDAMIYIDTAKSKQIWIQRFGIGYVVAGVALTLLGAFITFGSYAGLINTGNSIIVAYGPLLGGLSLFFYGLSKRKKAQSIGAFKRRWSKSR